MADFFGFTDKTLLPKVIYAKFYPVMYSCDIEKLEFWDSTPISPWGREFQNIIS